jgi:hypothetical protein
MSLPQVWHRVRLTHATTLATLRIHTLERTRLALLRCREVSILFQGTDVSRPYQSRTHRWSILFATRPYSSLSHCRNMTTCRRPYSTKDTKKKPNLANGTGPPEGQGKTHPHNQENGYNHDVPHFHSHSLFGHSHSNGVEDHGHGTEHIIAALEGKGVHL